MYFLSQSPLKYYLWNKIIFNRFTKDTGVSFKDLKTFEGIINVAEKYYEWSDNQTPDIKNDGKTFFMIDSFVILHWLGGSK